MVVVGRPGSLPDMVRSRCSRSRNSKSRSRILSRSRISRSLSRSRISLSNLSRSDKNRGSSYLSTTGRSGLYSIPCTMSSRRANISGGGGLPISMGRDGGG